MASPFVASMNKKLKEANMATKYDVGVFAGEHPSEMKIILALYGMHSTLELASGDMDAMTSMWTQKLQLLTSVCKSFRWSGKYVAGQQFSCLVGSIDFFVVVADLERFQSEPCLFSQECGDGVDVSVRVPAQRSRRVADIAAFGGSLT